MQSACSLSEFSGRFTSVAGFSAPLGQMLVRMPRESDNPMTVGGVIGSSNGQSLATYASFDEHRPSCLVGLADNRRCVVELVDSRTSQARVCVLDSDGKEVLEFAVSPHASEQLTVDVERDLVITSSREAAPVLFRLSTGMRLSEHRWHRGAAGPLADVDLGPLARWLRTAGSGTYLVSPCDGIVLLTKGPREDITHFQRVAGHDLETGSRF